MAYLGSPQHIVEMLTRFIRARIGGPSAIDRSDTRIDRQRRVIGLILFAIFFGLPAAFLLLWTYFPDFAARLFR
jgi:hypothetical protein